MRHLFRVFLPFVVFSHEAHTGTRPTHAGFLISPTMPATRTEMARISIIVTFTMEIIRIARDQPKMHVNHEQQKAIEKRPGQTPGIKKNRPNEIH